MQLHRITALYSLNATVFSKQYMNAFYMVLTLNLCILKVTDATALEFMLPIYH